MAIDYYQTPEQQELAFQRYNNKSYYNLLEIFSKVNLHWGGDILFTFNKGTDDKVSFKFLIVGKRVLVMFLNSTTQEQKHKFSELAQQNIRTVKGVLDFLIRGIDSKSKSYELTNDGIGKKYDNGKPMAGTLTDVFSRALLAVGACIEYGTHKYPDPKN